MRALGSIAQVAGTALNQHLSSLIPALLEAVVDKKDDNTEIRKASDQIVLAVEDEGVSTLFNELVEQLSNPNPIARQESCRLIDVYTTANTDLSDAHVTLLLQVITDFSFFIPLHLMNFQKVNLASLQ